MAPSRSRNPALAPILYPPSCIIAPPPSPNTSSFPITWEEFLHPREDRYLFHQEPASPISPRSQDFQDLSTQSPPCTPGKRRQREFDPEDEWPGLYCFDNGSPNTKRRLLEEMSFLSTTTNYLQAKLEIQFENGGNVDMLGCANTGTGYSLPGHVVITLPALLSQYQGKCRVINSLSLTVEGKSEFSDNTGRYTPLRVWKTTLELATPQKPLYIPYEKSSKSRIQLSIPFDITLPGWLPPTDASTIITTAYGAKCSGTIKWYEQPSSYQRTSTPSSKCQSPYKEFKIRRHHLPSSLSITGEIEPTIRHYRLKSEDVSSPVECIISVPDWVDLNGCDKNLRISLRVRASLPDDDTFDWTDSDSPGTSSGTSTPGSDDSNSSVTIPSPAESFVRPSYPVRRNPAIREDGILTYMTEIGMEVEENVRISSDVMSSFTSLFPLSDDQPGQGTPLLCPRPYDGFGGNGNSNPFRSNSNRACLLADDGNQRNFFFSDSGLALGDKWRKVNVVLPMPIDTDRQKANKPRAETDGPFHRIRHSLKIRIVCKNPSPDSPETAVILTTPIRFGTSPFTFNQSSHKSTLPAYIQIFHENGDLRECDPLPLYTDSIVEESAPATPIRTETPEIKSQAIPIPILSPLSQYTHIGSTSDSIDTSPDYFDTSIATGSSEALSGGDAVPSLDGAFGSSSDDNIEVTTPPPPAPISSTSQPDSAPPEYNSLPSPTTRPGRRKFTRQSIFGSSLGRPSNV